MSARFQHRMKIVRDSEGFEYNSPLAHKGKSALTMFWRCRQRKRFKCNAKVTTKDGVIVPNKFPCHHTHEPFIWILNPLCLTPIARIKSFFCVIIADLSYGVTEHIVTSKRHLPMRILRDAQGYEYSSPSPNANQTVRWRCRYREKFRCFGRILTKDGVIVQTCEHTHSPYFP